MFFSFFSFFFFTFFTSSSSSSNSNSNSFTSYGFEDNLNYNCNTSLILNISKLNKINIKDGTNLINLPWLFPFFNKYYNQAYLSSNGILSFINPLSIPSSPSLSSSSSSTTSTTSSKFEDLLSPSSKSETEINSNLIIESNNINNENNNNKIKDNLNKNNKYIIVFKSHIERFHHENFILSLQNMHKDSKKTNFQLTIENNYPMLKMFSISNPSNEALHYLQTHEDIENIHKNIEFQVDIIKHNNNNNNLKNKKATKSNLRTNAVETAYSWGIDRVNQYYLPLDQNNTIPSYTNYGKNVDVYVIDSGIDTTHQEFQRDPLSTFHRNVTNIFSLYDNLPDNNDGYGHGTHVAGTIGGNTIGVAKYVNLYGVKVISDTGAGSTEAILSGMNYVLSIKQNIEYQELLSSSNPMIVSMSLGYKCGDQCQLDPLVLAVEHLTKAGIVVVIAAGNNKFDACYVAPASASTAITVGATIINDQFATTFSNYGPCVDILAPGTGITSACSSKGILKCDTNSIYMTISGTSMATPHISGIIALWLSMIQIKLISMDLNKVQQITNILQCNSITNQITLVSSTAYNYFSYIPKKYYSNFNDITCSQNEQSIGTCNSNTCIHGICLSKTSQCSCLKGYKGKSCNISTWQELDPLCCNGKQLNDAYNYPYDSISILWTNLDVTNGIVSSGSINSTTYAIRFSNVGLFHKPLCTSTFELLLHSCGNFEIVFVNNEIGVNFDCSAWVVSVGFKGSYNNGINIESYQWYGPSGLYIPKCFHRIAKYGQTTAPTSLPTNIPTTSYPTYEPTFLPSNIPTILPTSPTLRPSIPPPTFKPSQFPSKFPTRLPTKSPSIKPTLFPSILPTKLPTKIPTLKPTFKPSQLPSFIPTRLPTKLPSIKPTLFPSILPTKLPTKIPTLKPSFLPTKLPTKIPTKSPTLIPSRKPTPQPSILPTILKKLPTYVPSRIPTVVPSKSTTTRSPTI